jgi:hypothetical protein
VENQGGVRPSEEPTEAARGVGSDLRGVFIRDDSARWQSAAVSRESIHMTHGPLHAQGRPLSSGYAPSEHLLGAMADRGPVRRMVPAFSSGMPHTAPPCHEQWNLRLDRPDATHPSGIATNTRDATKPGPQRLDATVSRLPDERVIAAMGTCALDISPFRRVMGPAPRRFSQPHGASLERAT